MAKKNSIAGAFNTPRRPKTTSLGSAGYDNARDNIDPHVKTKVISSSEGSIEKTPVNDNDIVNKKYVDDGSHWSILSNNIYNTNTGNVGIGTSTPRYQLDVVDGARDFIIDLTSDIIIGTTVDQPLKFITDGTEKMIIEEDGNVGIGISSPEATLHVNGLADSTPEEIAKFSVSDASNSYLSIRSSTAVTGKMLPTIKAVNGDDSRNAMYFFGFVKDDIYFSKLYPALMFDSRTIDSDPLETVPIIGFANYHELKFVTWFDGSTKIGGDDVLITDGAVKPTTMLDVVNTDSNDLLNLLDGTDSRLYVEQDGNVGIGTDTPDALFEVDGANLATAGSVLLVKDTGGEPAISMVDTWYDSGSIKLGDYDGAADGHHLTIEASKSYFQDGNVGIGTTSPTEALDITSDKFRLRTANTPASASSTGAVGEICWDSSYVYVCVATNTWKRSALSTW